MKPSRAFTALAVVALAVAARAGAAHRTVASTAPVATSYPGATAAAPPAVAPGIPRPQRASGDFRRYAVDGRLVLASDGARAVESAAPAQRLEGAWLETVARIEAGRVTLVVVFTPREVAPETLSRTDLARPFGVELDEDGRVAAVTFAPGVSGDARQALRAVVAEMQLTRAGSASARAWQVDEEDTTGRYHASYRASSSTEVERRKGGYALVLSDRGLAPPGDGEGYDADGVTRYRLDDGGALVQLGLRESLHVVTGAELPALDALVRLDARLTDQGHGPVPALVEGASERLATLTATPGGDATHDTQMARGADFAALQARLRDLERMDSKALRVAATHVIPQARAVLRIYPRAAADAARVVADPTTPPATAGILGVALAIADTDEARAALVGLARSDDAAVRLASLRALTQLRNPDDESIDTVKSLLGDQDPEVAGAAGLALGAGIRQAGGASAGDANASAVAALMARYQAATDDATRVTTVYALGNAGGREVLPVMLDALGRSAPVVEAAVFALRFVPGADVDQLLRGALSGGSQAMRVAAVQAVLARDRSAWSPSLATLLQGELPQAVRQAIVAGLGTGR